MKITELKNNVAVQIDDFDIRDITPENAKKTHGGSRRRSHWMQTRGLMPCSV